VSSRNESAPNAPWRWYDVYQRSNNRGQRGPVLYLSPAESVLEHSTGFQQLVWRARYDVLILELVALTGSPKSRKLTFEPAFGYRGGYSPIAFARQRRLQKAFGEVPSAVLDKRPG
jgi:hypothetical protein